MKSDRTAAAVIPVMGLVLWGLVIAGPLIALLVAALSEGSSGTGTSISVNPASSFIVAGGIAVIAVLLGWFPGRLLGTSSRMAPVLLLLLLVPLMLPRYLLFYAWQILLSPTTSLGAYLSSRPGVARAISTATSWFVLVTWHWSLAAMILSQGWRNIDRGVWAIANLECGRWGRFVRVTLPLMGRSLVLAWGCCFVLVLSEFGTFHLAGIRTYGTELAVLYQLTGSTGAVARAAWPVVVVALGAAVGAGFMHRQWFQTNRAGGGTGRPLLRDWVILGLLGVMTCGLPVGILVMGVRGTESFKRFAQLHMDGLLYSAAIGGLAALIAHLIGWVAVVGGNSTSRCRKGFVFVLRCSILLAMFVPASLIAVGVLGMLISCGAPDWLRQGWYIVAMGQGARFAGLAMVVLMLTRYPDQKRLSEMALLDGAGPWRTWWSVHGPRVWPVLLGGFLLVIAMSVTELSATMVLLPAGLPNFAQRLLNQMHYAKDQQVIASCLILICFLVGLSGLVVLLLGVMRRHRMVTFMVLLGMAVGISGCGRKEGEGPNVVRCFGRTGAGAGEFLYPRAIDYGPDGRVLVIDKTGRIQQFNERGTVQSCIQMPLIEAGKPTGLTLGEDGRLYVADTHYHRVLVFSKEGEIVQAFGSFGRENGKFIYPTDIAIGPDGRLYVGEYGGNDRISVFDGQGQFLFSFGEPGSEEGQFSRPSALCIDSKKKVLYVADACNHRIGVYDLEGRLSRYIGSTGQEPGQLRYPYDLALLDDPDGAKLVVCEYGNNRIQIFDGNGRSVGMYGHAGREVGQLAYPWGVAVGKNRQVFIVDAGNNRIQVWQL